MTKILSYSPWGLAALLRGDREDKSLRENRRVKMFAAAGYHAVVCDNFIWEYKMKTKTDILVF